MNNIEKQIGTSMYNKLVNKLNLLDKETEYQLFFKIFQNVRTPIIDQITIIGDDVIHNMKNGKAHAKIII